MSINVASAAPARHGRRVLIGGLLMALCAPGDAAPGPLSLAQYRAGLLQARRVAMTALPDVRRESDAAAIRNRLRTVLPLQARVQMPSGATIEVDNRPLLQALDEGGIHSRYILPQKAWVPVPAERWSRREDQGVAHPVPGRRLRNGRNVPWVTRAYALRLTAHAALLRFIASIDGLLAATGAPPPAFDRARADRVLKAVLSRPEYRPKQKGQSLEERLLLWLIRLLQRLFPHSAWAASGDDRLARLMLAGALLLLAVLVARVLLLVLPDLRLPRRAAAEPPAGELLVPQEPGALLAQAEQEAAAGRYREALRLVYLATVGLLDRAGVLPEDRSRTHWELLRDLRRRASDESRVTGNEGQPPHSSLVSLLAPLTRRLDERLYGGRTATAEDYQACRAAHDQIERLLCAPA